MGQSRSFPQKRGEKQKNPQLLFFLSIKVGIVTIQIWFVSAFLFSFQWGYMYRFMQIRCDL